MAGVALQTGIVDLLHVGVGLQILGNRHCVLAVTLNTQRQGLHASQYQIAVEGRGRAAIDLRHGVAADQAHIGSGADHNAAQRIAVAVDVLGDAVQDHVRAQLQHVLNGRRCKGSVHHHADILAGDCLDSRNVRHLDHGVVGGLEINHLGVGLDGGLQCLQIGGIHARDLNAHIGEVYGRHCVGAAVNRVVKDHMVAALQERDHHRTDCAHAGGGGHSVLTALHGGALQLEGTGGGVSAAGVLIAGDLLGKLVSTLLHSFKAES